MAVEGSQGLSIRTMMTTAYLLNQQALRKSWLLEFQGAFHHTVADVLMATQNKAIISNTLGVHGTARSPLVPLSAPVLSPGLRNSRSEC